MSEPLHPVGAIAEPYALWAIERQPRHGAAVRPRRHRADRRSGAFERLKLWLLNLGHTLLAESLALDGRAPDKTVLEAMHDAALRDALEALWHDEVLPVFDALGQDDAARAYLVDLRDRLSTRSSRTAWPTSRRTMRRRSRGASSR